MAELDLIPPEYRRALRARRWARNFALAYAVTLALVAGTRIALSRGIAEQRATIERLRQEKSVSVDQLAQLQQLQQRKAEAQRRAEVLSGLRGGPPAEAMFQTFDRALDPQVWFLSWRFRRAGEMVTVEPETVQTGYFIVIPSGERQPQQQAWRLQTHMEVKGQARSHAALAAFVGRLLSQPEIEDVRVLSTASRRYTTTEVVDFELTAVVDSRPEGP